MKIYLVQGLFLEGGDPDYHSLKNELWELKNFVSLTKKKNGMPPNVGNINKIMGSNGYSVEKSKQLLRTVISTEKNLINLQSTNTGDIPFRVFPCNFYVDRLQVK